MNKALIERINYYAKLKKERCLTPEEQKEQEKLRAEYLKLFRESFRKRLENLDIEFVDE
ncbi:DUF896 domain-containing protein [Guggenheimella bovis]